MKICDFCGAEISNNEKVCPICGFEMQIDARTPMLPDKAKNNRQKPTPVDKLSSDSQEQRNTLTNNRTSSQSLAIRIVIPIIAFAVCFISISLASAALIVMQNTKESPLGQGYTDSVYSVPSISNVLTRQGNELGESNMDSSRSFSARNTVDGDHDTCWCVNTNEWGGAGAEIEFVLSEKTYVHGLRIINGNQYAPDKDLFNLNGQVSSALLQFLDEDGNENGSELLNVVYNSGNRDEWQTINLSNAVYTDRIVLKVVSSFAGSLYQTNVCITEVEFF